MKRIAALLLSASMLGACQIPSIPDMYKSSRLKKDVAALEAGVSTEEDVRKLGQPTSVEFMDFSWDRYNYEILKVVAYVDVVGGVVVDKSVATRE